MSMNTSTASPSPGAASPPPIKVGLSRWNNWAIGICFLLVAMAVTAIAGLCFQTYNHIGGSGPEDHGWDIRVIEELCGSAGIGLTTGAILAVALYCKRKKDRAQVQKLIKERAAVELASRKEEAASATRPTSVRLILTHEGGSSVEMEFPVRKSLDGQ